MSAIIGFWRTENNNNDLNENMNINNIENIIKDLSEIMIIHHKIYLLICLWILNNSNYFNCDFNNEEKVILLKEQMKKYLPKKFCGNNYYYINNNLINDELKSSCNILYSILKIILTENRNNNVIYKLTKNINNLKEIETSELVSYFYNYINSNNNNPYIDSFNNLNINEYQKNLNEDTNTYLDTIPFNKKSIYSLNGEYIRHRRIQSNLINISNINSINKDDFPFNNNLNNNIINQKDKNNNYQYINNNNNYSFNKSYYSNKFYNTNISNQSNYNNTNFNDNNNISDTANIKDNYIFNCRNKINNSYCNIKPKPPYLSNINLKIKKFQKKIT